MNVEDQPAVLVAEDIDILSKYAQGKNRIVELGTNYGGGSIVLAKFGKEVITIDIFENIDLIDDAENKAHYKLLFDEDPYSFAAVSARLSKFANIKVIQNLTFAEAQNHKAVDMIFIDADHSYNGVKRDFESWYGSVVPGGIIAFHDTISTGWPGIVKFIQELKQDNRVTFIELKGSVSVFKKI